MCREYSPNTCIENWSQNTKKSGHDIRKTIYSLSIYTILQNSKEKFKDGFLAFLTFLTCQKTISQTLVTLLTCNMGTSVIPEWDPRLVTN